MNAADSRIIRETPPEISPRTQIAAVERSEKGLEIVTLTFFTLWNSPAEKIEPKMNACWNGKGTSKFLRMKNAMPKANSQPGYESLVECLF